MQAIRSKDTSIELMLRRELWSRGIRYRKNCKDVPGKPDLVFKGKKVAVFCDSEFWHGFDWDNQKNKINTNKEFWISKIERNMIRDQEVNLQLEQLGYYVLRFWGNEIKKHVTECADKIASVLHERS